MKRHLVVVTIVVLLFLLMPAWQTTAMGAGDSARAEEVFKQGVAYAKLDRWQEAAAAFKEAIRLEPNDAKAHLALGCTYLVLRNRIAALEEYKILQSMDREKAAKLLKLINK